MTTGGVGGSVVGAVLEVVPGFVATGPVDGGAGVLGFVEPDVAGATDPEGAGVGVVPGVDAVTDGGATGDELTLGTDDEDVVALSPAEPLDAEDEPDPPSSLEHATRSMTSAASARRDRGDDERDIRGSLLQNSDSDVS